MGHTVISGLAYGVDEAAHRGALMAGGPTIAVLPGGVNRPHPTAHTQLLEAITSRGGLAVSEAPPGTGVTRARFLARNRVIAGLAEGAVLIEGAPRSGALNTAQWASNLHRPVMGLPGPVTSTTSAGVNQLIRLGQASVVIDAQDVITDLTTHATTSRPDRVDAVNESFVPGPVRSMQNPAGAPAVPAAGPHR